MKRGKMEGATNGGSLRLDEQRKEGKKGWRGRWREGEVDGEGEKSV